MPSSTLKRMSASRSASMLRPVAGTATRNNASIAANSGVKMSVLDRRISGHWTVRLAHRADAWLNAVDGVS